MSHSHVHTRTPTHMHPRGNISGRKQAANKSKAGVRRTPTHVHTRTPTHTHMRTSTYTHTLCYSAGRRAEKGCTPEFDLFAATDIPAGTELCISYCSTVFPQKSPASPQKNPAYLQKRHTDGTHTSCVTHTNNELCHTYK